MTDPIRFILDGAEVEAAPGETIWQVADRRGIEIPHLCWLPKPGYRADGNCRACMVEIEGERVLAASCIRKPAPGHEGADRERARQVLAQDGVRTAGRRPAGAGGGARPEFAAVAMGRQARRRRQPLSAARRTRTRPQPLAMAVQLDACIQCNLCVRACREVQVNDVIGMAARGWHEKIVFDFDDPMGNSTCVACGECVQACPTGALDAGDLGRCQRRLRQRARPRGRQRLPLLRRRLPAHLPDQERPYRRRRWARRPGQPQPALRQGPVRLRLCPPSRPADRAADPQGRRPQARHRRSTRPTPTPISARRAGTRRSTAPPRASSASATATASGRSPGSARPRGRTRRPICSRSWCAPGSAATMSTTARGSATPRRSRR